MTRIFTACAGVEQIDKRRKRAMKDKRLFLVNFTSPPQEEHAACWSFSVYDKVHLIRENVNLVTTVFFSVPLLERILFYVPYFVLDYDDLYWAKKR